jgi:hypothetical protein
MPGASAGTFGTKYFVIRHFIHRRLVRNRHYIDKSTVGQPINSLLANARGGVA